MSTAARLVEHEWNLWLADHELTHAGLLALDALKSGPMTQRALAAANRVEEQTMSRVLERLERNGHVTRHRDEVDRRRLVIERTAKGAAVAKRALKARVADRLVADRVEDVDQFRNELARIVEAARPARDK